METQKNSNLVQETGIVNIINKSEVGVRVGKPAREVLFDYLRPSHTDNYFASHGDSLKLTFNKTTSDLNKVEDLAGNIIYSQKSESNYRN